MVLLYLFIGTAAYSLYACDMCLGKSIDIQLKSGTTPECIICHAPIRWKDIKVLADRKVIHDESFALYNKKEQERNLLHNKNWIWCPNGCGDALSGSEAQARCRCTKCDMYFCYNHEIVLGAITGCLRM